MNFNQKARIAIDNVRVILKKKSLIFVYGKFMASFPPIYSRHLTILGSCYCKNQIEVSFLCVCRLINKKFVLTLSKFTGGATRL